MSEDLTNVRRRIVEMAALLFERRLFDISGGNISQRVGDVVCLTPRYAASEHHWKLGAEQIIVADLQGNRLDGKGEISRESKVHLALYAAFANGNAVVHAHAHNVLPFCAASLPIPPVLEFAKKLGETRVAEAAPAHSAQLAQNIVQALRGQEERIAAFAAAVIAPQHGLFVMGKDLDAAVGAVERVDTNAHAFLVSLALSSMRGAPHSGN
jgi:L-fuculose-phosphate aldolase